MPKRERFSNNAATTLNGAITSSATSLTVNSASAFPNDGNFRIVIGSEIMLVTAVSGGTFTVERGVEGTSPTSHADADTVTHIVTQGSLERMTLDNVPFAGQVPPLGRIADASGNIITSSSFTWLNQGSATVTDRGGNIRMYHPTGTSSLNLRGLYVAAPSSPWQATCALQSSLISDGAMGIFVRESATGKFMWIARAFSVDSLLVERFTDPTTFVSPSRLNNYCRFDGALTWLRVRCEAPDLRFSISDNGVDWMEVYSEGLTDHFTAAPDQAGFVFNASNDSNAQMSMTVLHWSFD